MAKWTVKLDDLSQGGFAPQYWRENYPRFGNSNQAGAMTAMDLSRAGYIQPGPAVVLYPGGASVVTTTISSFATRPDSANTVYGVGGQKIYKLVFDGSSYTSASLIHTISATSATTLSHDIVAFRGSNYYSYRGNSGNVANVGKWDAGFTNYDDDWWTAALSAATFQTLSGSINRPPLAMEVGQNDVLYIANGRYVASYDGTTAQAQALDLPENSEISDLVWMGDRLYIPAWRFQYGVPVSSLYIWDGTTNSWEAEVPVNGQTGANYELNGTYYQFYNDRTGTNKLAVLEGNRLRDIASFPGEDVVRFNQVTDWDGFIVWVPGEDSADVYAYGTSHESLPPRLFHFADAGTAGTGLAGGLTNAFGNSGLLISNNSTLSYLDTYLTPTYSTNSTWKSTLFDITGDRINAGQINAIRFNFEALTSGAVLDWSLVNNQGKTIYSDKISYAKATASNPLHTLTTAFYPLNGKVTENFRVELNYANGSTTAPVRVMNIKCYGEG